MVKIRKRAIDNDDSIVITIKSFYLNTRVYESGWICVFLSTDFSNDLNSQGLLEFILGTSVRNHVFLQNYYMCIWPDLNE